MGSEVHLALKVKLETLERTGLRVNLGLLWMYKKLLQALVFRCLI